MREPKQLNARSLRHGPKGLVGIGIQFGLWRFINGHFILGSNQADAAYEALVRLTGKDCTAEAHAIVKHAGV